MRDGEEMNDPGRNRGGAFDVVDLVVNLAFKPVGAIMEDMRL